MTSDGQRIGHTDKDSHRDAHVDIATLERLAARIYQVETTIHLDGWQLRYHYGISRRANSVWPIADEGRLELAQKLHLAETLYTNANVAPRFHMSPASQPQGLQELLLTRGYERDGLTNVCIAELETVLDRANAKPFEVWLKPELNPQWLEHHIAFARPERANIPAYRTLFENIASPCVFASVRQDNAVIALGQCVFDPQTKLAGILNISTLPHMRRRGVATTLLTHLATWAKKQGATQLYLQVETDNANANALYNKLGFVPRYQYEYLVQPTPTS